MKSATRHFLLFLLLLLTFATAQATAWNAQNLPTFDDTRTHVCNPDGVLSQACVDSLDSMLLAMERHDVEVLAVCVKNIENDDPYEFAIGLGRRYGVGGSKNQGVVLVLATEDRSYQIVTGDGMEKFLPDIICSRIENQAMLPYLRNSDWDNAMIAGVGTMKGYLENQPEVVEQLRDYSTDDYGIGFGATLFFLGILIILGTALAASYKEKKCPKCGKHKLKVVSRNRFYDSNKDCHIRRTLVCQNCQHELTRESIIRHHNDYNDGGGFVIFGPSTGGSFGGGGISHGPFGGFGGGGTFGGGGAGGRF